jgi:hypothetical protein
VPPRITDSRAKLFLFFFFFFQFWLFRYHGISSSASLLIYPPLLRRSDLIRAATKQKFFSRDNAKKVTAANGAQEKRTIQPNR